MCQSHCQPSFNFHSENNDSINNKKEETSRKKRNIVSHPNVKNDGREKDQQTPMQQIAGSSMIDSLRREVLQAITKADKATKLVMELKNQVAKALVKFEDESNNTSSNDGDDSNNTSNKNDRNNNKRDGKFGGLSEGSLAQNDPQSGFSLASNHNDQRNNQSHASLSADTYTLMMTKQPLSKSWLFGVLIFITQITLLGLIFANQISTSIEDTIFGVPFKVDNSVRVSQFLAIFITIMISYDIFMPIRDLTILWIENPEWAKVVVGAIDTSDYRSLRHNVEDGVVLGRPSNERRKIWFLQILLPNVLKFIQGVLVLLITFVIVIQSDDTIDLFKDFAAMQVISELDNVAFLLARHGFFGFALKRDTGAAKEIKLVDRVPVICGLPLRPILLFGLLFVMNSVFIGLVVIGQLNGTFFSKKYPNCRIKKELSQITMINDGRCNNGLFNTFQCGFDGMDCIREFSEW